MSADIEDQENEIVALSSIFDDPETFEILGQCRSRSEGTLLKLIVEVVLLSPIEINFTKISDNISTKSATVSYLPPIYAKIVLPVTYPSLSKPKVFLTAAWLCPSLTQNILLKLKEISDQNSASPVLYLYYQFMKNECYELIGPSINLDMCQVTSSRHHKTRKHENNTVISNTKCDFNKNYSTHAPKRHNSLNNTGRDKQQLFDSLIDYNDYKSLKQFEKDKHSCDICCSELYGDQCVQFTPCKHVFCKQCCKQFFELHIKEGSFELLKCLATRCDTPAIPKFIRSVVDNAHFERYDRMTLTRSLDVMKDVVVCPRSDCGTFVVMDQDIKNMALCSQCDFAFCTLCRKVYHGVSLCSLSNSDVALIIEQYNSSDEKAREELESKYGKLVIKRLLEESSSRKWMSENCRPCPLCQSPIEKSSGCNKMWCSKCGAYFCWLCMKSLNKDNPYKHFNDPESQCFNLLFRGVRMDDEEDEDNDLEENNFGQNYIDNDDDYDEDDNYELFIAV